MPDTPTKAVIRDTWCHQDDPAKPVALIEHLGDFDGERVFDLLLQRPDGKRVSLLHDVGPKGPLGAFQVLAHRLAELPRGGNGA